MIVMMTVLQMVNTELQVRSVRSGALWCLSHPRVTIGWSSALMMKQRIRVGLLIALGKVHAGRSRPPGTDHLKASVWVRLLANPRRLAQIWTNRKWGATSLNMEQLTPKCSQNEGEDGTPPNTSKETVLSCGRQSSNENVPVRECSLKILWNIYHPSIQECSREEQDQQ